jgi:hypothetical protein
MSFNLDSSHAALLDKAGAVQKGKKVNLFMCTSRRHVGSGRVALKADSHMPCRVHAVPVPSHVAPLAFSNSAVSFVKVRVVAGNIRTASTTV